MERVAIRKVGEVLLVSRLCLTIHSLKISFLYRAKSIKDCENVD